MPKSPKKLYKILLISMPQIQSAWVSGSRFCVYNFYKHFLNKQNDYHNSISFISSILNTYSIFGCQIGCDANIPIDNNDIDVNRWNDGTDRWFESIQISNDYKITQSLPIYFNLIENFPDTCIIYYYLIEWRQLWMSIWFQCQKSASL